MKDEILKKGDRSSITVFGGGIAGMQSALLLARMGRKVFLVERKPSIGGFFPLLDKTFPTNSCGVCFMSPKPPAICPIHECRLHENIELLSNSRLVGFEGAGGDFRILLGRKPRFVDPEKCTLCGACFKVCPVEAESDFGGGLEKHKAIYRPFPQAIPPSPVIDEEICTRCRECVAVCRAGAIDLDMKGTKEELQSGAVILGFGFEPFEAGLKGEYGFGRYWNVISGVQFERMISTSSPGGGVPVRLSDGQEPGRVAFIQCVGSRDQSCGREYCSTVCCMYATKQAMIAKSRIPGLEATVYMMDARPMGKGYERYYERAGQEYGIEYRRCAVSSVKELQKSKNLLITSVAEDGLIREDEYSAVVLSVGFQTGLSVKKAAGMMGVELDEYGFCRTDEFRPALTSVPGIFVGGSFKGPRDIPETVVEGSAAAAEAAAHLLPAPAACRRKEYPVPGALGDEEPRIGVFICRCRGEISGCISFEKLLCRKNGGRNVAVTAEVDLACRAEGLEQIRDLFGRHSLNRIVLAGCSPREVKGPAEEMAREAGIDPGLIEYANIREQCAFVHENDPEASTGKAISLVEMAVERARRTVPVRSAAGGDQEKSVLVVGAGLAGMTASLGLARQGIPVHLVEKETKIGGNLRGSSRTARGNDPGMLLKDMEKEMSGQDLITLYAGADVVRMEGWAGHFETTVRQGDGDVKLKHGAVIVASGGGEIRPGAYLYGEDERVITQRKLGSILDNGGKELEGQQSFVMIQCAATRDKSHAYCSRICCTEAVRNAVLLKEKNPGAMVYILYRDIRTYGMNELYYREARRKGVIFIRYEKDRPPEVKAGDGGLLVMVFDPAADRDLTLAAGRLILSSGIEPSDNRDLAAVLGVALDEDGFFKEANPKSAPLDAMERGIFFCGLCHSPNFPEDIISQGLGAAARAAAVLSGDNAEEAPYKASVVKRLCAGCGLCVSACPYGARELNEEGIAAVDEIRCRGCGACAVSCRNGASVQLNFQKDITMAVVDAAIE